MANIGQSLNLRQEQKLVMTPQLQLAIKLLQMPTIDLQEFVSQELMDNPFLDSNDGTSEEVVSEPDAKSVSAETQDSVSALDNESLSEKDMSLDMGWDSMYESGQSSSGAAKASSVDNENSWEQTATEEKSLKAHLIEQLGLSTDEPVEKFVASYLIDAIDDSGYIRLDLDDVAERFNVDKEKVEDAMWLIQSFEPAGVGATSLEECLLLQIKQQKLSKKLKEITEVVLANLEILAHQDLKKLAKLAKCELDDIVDSVDLITSLTPKPGLKYGGENASTVIPDVIVTKSEKGWKAELNAEAMPKILLNNGYNPISAKSGDDDKEYMNERVSRAQWLIKSLEQRARTIFKVANTIVAEQGGFFDCGVENLQPMTLKNVAEIVEVHESTVSRVTNGKYMQTPMGVFELKYFFSSAIGTTGGNMQVASESVRQIIKRLVAEENPAKPLSDQKLVTLLKDEGIDVARRTVAKYRESLNIASSSGRRIKK